MGERITRTPNHPSRAILTGLTSATALVSLMGGCSSSENNPAAKPELTPQHDAASFACEGETKYIRFPRAGDHEAYIQIHLKNKDGTPFTDPARIRVREVKNGKDKYKDVVPLETDNTSSRAYIKLPRNIVRFEIDAYAPGSQSVHCDTLEEPYREQTEFTDLPSPTPAG